MKATPKPTALLLIIFFVLVGCGGGGGGGAPSGGTTAPAAPVLTLVFGLKQLQFSWTAVTDATHYRLFENPDGVSGFTQVGGDLSATSTALDIAVHRHDWANARYLVEACNATGCTASNDVATLGQVLRAIGYFKASNTGAIDRFGESVALSADGKTVAVAARLEASAATGINGDQTDNSALGAGAVYVFTRSGEVWGQQAYIKASNTEVNDGFGTSVALSSDGSTLAVGAQIEDSVATGVGGDQADNSASGAGAVYVYTRSGSTWSQQAYVKASNTEVNDGFGISVALSSDGSTLAVGAHNEDSAASGINGDQTDNLAADAGAVYVFTRSGSTWSQQAYVKASNTGADDWFGFGAVALSSDGNTLAVGARNEDSAATGINGDHTDNSAANAGAVYVYIRSGSAWMQEAFVKASNTAGGDFFGGSVALSGDGNTLVVGAGGEDSAATGIDGDQVDNSAPSAGAVYIFTRSGSTWSQQAYVKASNTNASDQFGFAVALSSDGSSLAVGANVEDSAATGINGDQADDSAADAGAVYVFTRSGSTWMQEAYVKASNTGAGDFFGGSVALNGDGNTVAVGASQEDSAATGIGGGQADNSASSAGAVYLY